MPVPPAELTAEFTVAERGPADAARTAAGDSGIAIETGPDTTALSGPRGQVLDALAMVIGAALDAGASRIEVRLQAPSGARPPADP